MKTAMITGSFDPVTSGHYELIRKAAAMFDEVVVLIVPNGEKSKGMFSNEERKEFMDIVVNHLRMDGIDNVISVQHAGLTSDIAKKYNVNYYVRGVRSVSDFDYEYNLAGIMKRFSPDIETIFIPATDETMFISSTYVRELLKYHCPLENAVPECVAERMREVFEGKGNLN